MTFLGRGPTPWIRLRNAAGAVCVLGLLGLASFRSEAMRNRLFAAAETGNLAGRERIYPALLVMMRERPAIGWGPVENQYELEHRLKEPGFIKRDAHNLVLELMPSTGMAGTIPFLIRLLMGLRSGWRARPTPPGLLPLAIRAAFST